MRMFRGADAKRSPFARLLAGGDRERGVLWSIASQAANAMFCTLATSGSATVTLFLSDLGFSKTQIGALGSLDTVSALLALFIAPAVIRWGLKRTYITSWGIRKGVTALLMLAPTLVTIAGVEPGFAFVVSVIGAFAICRAIGLTAYSPWSQEFVPNAIRGKYSAMSNITTTLASLIAVGIATFVMGRVAGIGRYTLLIGIGVGFGVLCVWLATLIPRETLQERNAGSRMHFRTVLSALRDKDYVLYLVGIVLAAFATAAWSFLPLFMREKVGLSSQAVVTLQTGTLLGSMLSSYHWGWAADRYGSKPVMLLSLATRTLLPLFWLFMPRQSGSSLLIAQAIAFLDGASSSGFAIGAGRLLFVRIIPREGRTSYLALYSTWTGVAAGLAPLLGGRILDAAATSVGQWGILRLDAYTPLFLAGSALFCASLLLFSRVHSDACVSGVV
jgi:MFS family permease